MKRPNILFVFSDQHRFCDLGYAGNPEVETPNLDSLAREGAHFTHAYTSCPLCVPARGTLLTSLHALRHGAAANDRAIKNDCTSVAHVLTGAGYNTAYIGKWHLGGVPRNQFITKERRLGFEYWRGCECNHNYLSAYYDDNDNVRHLIDGYEPITQTNLAIEYMSSKAKRAPLGTLAMLQHPSFAVSGPARGEAEIFRPRFDTEAQCPADKI